MAALTIRSLSVVVLVVVVGSGVGCSANDPGESDVLQREDFVEVYVALQRLGSAEDVDSGTRERILREHGVEAADLLHFVDVHGHDPAYMHDVWREIQARLASADEPAAPTSPPSADNDEERAPGAS